MNAKTMREAAGTQTVERAGNDAMQQLRQETVCSLTAMAAYWATRKHEFLWLAGDLFLGFVDPACRYGEEPLTTEEQLNMIFTEWMLYEFPFYDGRTPLKEYLVHPPHTAHEHERAILAQVACTQFFSRFEIRAKDHATGMCALVDARTAQRYDVLDPRICTTDRWQTGTIALRIACVRGTWLPVGQTVFYDRAAPRETASDGPGSFHPEDRIRKPWAEQAGFYLRLVRDVLGIDGRYRATSRFFPVNAPDAPDACEQQAS